MLEYCDSAGIYADFDTVGVPASRNSVLRRWNSANSGGIACIALNKGARGNPAFYIGFGGAFNKTLTHQSTFTWGQRVKMSCLNGVGGGSSLMRFANSGFTLASLKVDESGAILVYGNNLLSFPICATPGPVVEADKDVYIGFQANISQDGLGNLSVAAEVRINGVHVTRGSADIGRNVSTLNGATATFNQIFLDSGVNSNGQAYVSDLYITNGAGDTNTGFLERASYPYLVVLPIFTESDTVDLSWTPSRAGTHWDLVNKFPTDDDTTYVASSTPGQVDSWNWQDIPSFAGTVRSAQLSLSCRSTEEGTRTLKGNIGPAGLEEQTTEFGLCSSYFWRHQAFDKDPATARAWTRKGFNDKPWGGTLIQ